jgi:hypothetical protein
MKSHVELFKSEDDKIQLKVRLDEDTVWLNRNEISILFERDVKTIGKHINNVFKDGELDKKLVVAKFATTTKHGAMKDKTQTKLVEFYNLDVVISVGYRIKSHRGVQFRQWATRRLKDFVVQGYAINQYRIKENRAKFIKTLEDLKSLSRDIDQLEAKDILTLIQDFSDTFFALDRYDKNSFPNLGTQHEINASAGELSQDLKELKSQLIIKR